MNVFMAALCLFDANDESCWIIARLLTTSSSYATDYWHYENLSVA